MAKALDVSISSYYRWNKQQTEGKIKNNTKLLANLKEVFEQSKQRYGSRRITKVLKSKGISCYKNKISKLMQENMIYPKYKRRYRATTDSNHNQQKAPDLVQRNFNPNKPNKIWVGDITYIETKQGWLYLSVVIDLYSRKIISWKLSKTMKKELVISSLNEAIMKRKPESGFIFHSDRGSQYASREFKQTILKNKGRQSMSRKGNCWDNAVAESFFKTIKNELLNHKKYKTKEEVQRDIFEYIEIFYNRKRIHSNNQYLSPHDYEIKFVC